jgi:hypothetical protein
MSIETTRSVPVLIPSVDDGITCVLVIERC